MKKSLYVLEFIFLMFFLDSFVYAADVTRYNTCSGNINNSSLSSECEDQESYVNNPTGENDTITWEEEIVSKSEDECGERVPYNIVILLDISSSMKNDNKQNNVVNAVNNMIDTLAGLVRNYSLDFQVNVCKFGHNYFGCSDFKTISSNLSANSSLKLSSSKYFVEFGSGNELSGQATYIQYGLYRAGEYLRGMSNNNAPMVILVTDGYPTKANSSILRSTSMTADNTFNNMTSARYAYYTLRQLINLRSVLDTKASSVGRSGQAKILTYNVNSLIANDAFSNFVLNPNSSTKNALDDNVSKEAYSLYQMVNGQSVYESFAGVWMKEDYGVYRGDPDDNTVTFTFDKNVYSGLSADVIKSSLRFFFPSGSNDDVKKIEVKFYKNNQSTVDTLCDSSARCSSSGSDSGFKYFKLGNFSWESGNYTRFANCLSGDGTCNYNKVEVVFTISDSLTYTRYDSLALPSNLVNNSFSGSASDFENVFSDSVKNEVCQETEEIVVEEETYRDDVSKYEYNNCSSKGVSISSLYYKVTADDEYYSTRDGNNPISEGRCIKVDSNRLEYIMTEDLIFNVGTLNSIGSIYAGGGFSWADTQVENNIYARFKYLYSDGGITKPVFTSIGLSAYDLLGNSVTKSYVGISELYSDSSCRTSVTMDDLDSAMRSSISENITKDTTAGTIASAFETVDSNDASVSNDVIDFSVVSPSYELSYSSSDLLYSTTRSLSYSLGWYRACLSDDGRTVSYTTAPTCDEKEVDGGFLRYTSLNQPDGEYYVSINNKNFSSVDGIEFEINISCPVNVVQILYDDPGDDGDLEVAYTYRSIDHNNPFPKGVIPFNWQAFMDDDDGRTRLSDSYLGGNLNYEISFRDEDLDDIANGNDYTDWSNIDVETGSSDFANKIKRNATYCPLGEFRDDCD